MTTSYWQQKFAAFEQFEASLMPAQRHLLQQHPDLLSPDLINHFVGNCVQQARDKEGIISNQDSKPTKATTLSSPKRKQSRKVVNSFMTFRSYYSTLMKDLPQKNRSPMLSMLWKGDPDKALWQLLSESFSHVRDNHSEDAVTMDKFLATAAQVIPIIPPDQYFQRCGWIRNGHTLSRVEGATIEPSKGTNVSAAGLVRYCFRTGLITKSPINNAGTSKHSGSIAGPHSRISLVATTQTSQFDAFSPPICESAYAESPSTASSRGVHDDDQGLTVVINSCSMSDDGCSHLMMPIMQMLSVSMRVDL